MTKHISRLLPVAALALCISCASARPPFSSERDAALKHTIIEALGPYYTRTMNITVSGGRVYMEGELRDQQELMHAMSVIRETEGVTSVVEDVFLIDVGPNDGTDDYN